MFPKKSKTEANVTNLRLSQAMPQVWIGALACEHSRPVILNFGSMMFNKGELICPTNKGFIFIRAKGQQNPLVTH